MKELMQKKIGTLIRVGVVLIVFLLPVVFSNMVYDRYSMLRITMLRIFVPIIFFLWLLKKIAGEETLKISSIAYIAVAFIAIAGMATVLSKNSYLNFWGFYKFYVWGFSTLFLGFILFIVVLDEFKKEDWVNLGIVILLAATVVSVYGVMQILGFDPFYREGASFNRIFSTFGNPNFLGGYLVTVFPIAIAFYLGAPAKYVPYLLVLIIFLTLNLGLTLSRASWFAFGISIILFVFLVGSNIRREKSQRMLLLLAAIVVISLVFLMRRQPLISESLQKKSLVAERAGVMFDSGERSASLRIQTWRTSLNIFRNNFWHGVGPSMVVYAFPKYITPDFARQTDGKQISNYAHNTLLQSAAALGIFGLLIYLFLWFYSFYILISEKPKVDITDKVYYAAVAASFIALFVFLQFHFFLLTTEVYFWIMIAFIAQKRCRVVSIPVSLYKVAVPVAGLILMCGLYFGIRYFLADFYFEKAVVFGSNPEKSFSKAIELSPREWFYRKNFVSFYYILSQKTKNKSVKEFCLNEALKQAEINAELHPYNLMAVLDEAFVNLWQFQFLGKETLPDAEESLKKAYCLGPYFRVVLENLTKLYLLKGEPKNAEKYLTKMKDIYPSSLELVELENILESLKAGSSAEK